jgi:hypothetical protein
MFSIWFYIERYEIMFCTKCGSPLLDNALFCTKCGKAIEKRVLEKKGIVTLSKIISKEAAEFANLVEQNYELIHIKVTDVSFLASNESRQNILRNIKFHNEAFKDKIELSIKECENEGIIGFSIYANEQQIGNVPKGQVQYLRDNWNRIDKVSRIEVFGGYKLLHNQKRTKYGAEITIRLFQQGVYSWSAPYVWD